MDDILQQLKIGLHVEAEDLIAEIERNREAIAELVDALKGTMQELHSILNDINEDRIPHDGDEFHERLALASIAISRHTQPTKKGSN